MIGIFSKTTDSNIVESAGYSGLDFIILDMEHGPSSWEVIHDHVRASKVAGIDSIIRVKSNNPTEISKALDSGASGIQVPNIKSANQVRNVIKAAKFHPNGDRGVCRFVAAAGYGSIPKEEYFIESNKTKIIIQVEGEDGINEIDQILAVKGYDVLFIGPYDLSQSIGIPGKVDDVRIYEIIKNISNKIKKSNIKLGIFADNIETAKLMASFGCEYIAISVDVEIFREGCVRLVKGMNN